MGVYGDQVLPRCINVLLAGKPFREIRQRVASGLSGDVLEVGFGSGLNVPHYPSTVTRVLAVDPATVGRRLAAQRIAEHPVEVEFVGLDGASLALPSGSVDHVLVTWTMCTIPAVDTALAEMHRVLRPRGQLHFVEHGRSPDPEVARWQDRLNPVHRWWAGGCNLNRPIDEHVQRAGFEMSRLNTYYMRGPRVASFLYEGVATRSA